MDTIDLITNTAREAIDFANTKVLDAYGIGMIETHLIDIADKEHVKRIIEFGKVTEAQYLRNVNDLVARFKKSISELPNK